MGNSPLIMVLITISSIDIINSERERERERERVREREREMQNVFSVLTFYIMTHLLKISEDSTHAPLVAKVFNIGIITSTPREKRMQLSNRVRTCFKT